MALRGVSLRCDTPRLGQIGGAGVSGSDWPPPGVPVVRLTRGEFDAMAVFDPDTLYELVPGMVRGDDGRLHPAD